MCTLGSPNIFGSINLLSVSCLDLLMAKNNSSKDALSTVSSLALSVLNLASYFSHRFEIQAAIGIFSAPLRIFNLASSQSLSFYQTVALTSSIVLNVGGFVLLAQGSQHALLAFKVATLFQSIIVTQSSNERQILDDFLAPFGALPLAGAFTSLIE